MLSFDELVKMQAGLAARDPQFAATQRIVSRASGYPIPVYPFPAVITGKVLPKFKPTNQGGTDCNTPGIDCSRPWPNSPFVPDDPCTDPTDLDNCDDDAPPDTHLPCGVPMVRYKWEAPLIGLSSRMCGFRKNTQGNFLRWRQAFYAVNTAHATQDPGIDYDYVPDDMLVQMCFGDIELITGGTPKYGFFFHHMSDPPGANLCVDQNECGCCIGYDPNFPTIPVGRDCRTLENCTLTWAGFNHEWFPAGTPEYQACVSDKNGTYSCDQVPCFGV